MIVYLFYYEQSEIVDHDEDGAVYELVRSNLGAFHNHDDGLKYYQYKYPNKRIQSEGIIIQDLEDN